MNGRFPIVQGQNLLKQERVLPQELAGDFNIVIIAFQRWQQQWVNSWIPTLESLVGKHKNLEYYELPTIRKMNFVARRIIDGGMRSGIPSNDTRRRTITLYIDKTPFKDKLHIEDEDTIYIFVVDQKGSIYFSTSGPFTQEKENELINEIEGLLSLS